MTNPLEWWRWKVDPAPDFLKHLKDDELRAVFAGQLDQQIAAVKAQRAILEVQLAHFQEQEKILTQVKTTLAKKRI
jgi:hypothetical protein